MFEKRLFKGFRRFFVIEKRLGRGHAQKLGTFGCVTKLDKRNKTKLMNEKESAYANVDYLTLVCVSSTNPREVCFGKA